MYKEPGPVGRLSRGALAVKALALAQLAIGFVAGVVVARLAVARLGLEGFGDFAFLLGFAAAFALADLGIVPGLTTVVGERLRAGERGAAAGIVRAACRMTGFVWAALAVAALAFLHIGFPRAAAALALPLALFAAGAGLVGIADVGATLLRVDGGLAYVYGSRIAYQLVWAGGVGLAYVAYPRWDGVLILTCVQLLASIVFAAAIAARVAGTRAAGSTVRRGVRATVASEPWRRAWRLSAPERGVRVLGAVLTLGERAFLLALGATTLLGSYDLLLRIAVVISAVPSALAQPLLSMLAADHARAGRRPAYEGASGVTTRIAGVLALGGLAAATMLWVFFAEALFGVRPEVPLPLALCVFVATALNVLTATGVAVATFEGKVGIVNRKVAIEVAGVAVAAAAALAAGSAATFIALRYTALGVAATYFLARFPGARSDAREPVA